MYVSSFGSVQGEIAKYGVCCSYDRPGIVPLQFPLLLNLHCDFPGFTLSILAGMGESYLSETSLRTPEVPVCLLCP